ncbi:hypothetical protein ACFQT0_30640 [Hymenobacter humi]|uniref:Uncharacterized protein n=1 Tax=Hymenobacter humi TaxID=1411620 RepID=A0ABW2UGP9_9BACT
MEVSLYRVREQVESLFFGVLLADETTRLRQSLRADLRTRRTALAARRRYGTATGQDLARLDAETLSLDQQPARAWPSPAAACWPSSACCWAARCRRMLCWSSP